MLNSSLQAVRLFALLALMLLHVIASVPTVAKAEPSAVIWPRKCLKLQFSITDAELDWASRDKLHSMVQYRKMNDLRSYLRKDMLKGQKPAPEPYLITATRDIPLGASHYDSNFKAITADMERNGDEVVRLLLWAGANPDEKGMYQSTALMRIIRYQRELPKASPRIAKRLLEAGADPNLRDVNGWTALMFAAENGSSDIVALLLKHKARTDFKNCAGQTAADIASAKGHKALAKRLRTLP
jgi:hypothetical protein